VPTTRPLTSTVRPDQTPGAMRLSGPLAGPDVDALRHVGRLAARLLQAPAAAVTHAVGDTLHVVGFIQEGAPFATCSSLPLEDTACVEVLRSGLPMLLDDVDLLPAAPHVAALRAVGMRSYAGVPLRDAGGTPA
jgi:GAF domain-containing protein